MRPRHTRPVLPALVLVAALLGVGAVPAGAAGAAGTPEPPVRAASGEWPSPAELAAVMAAAVPDADVPQDVAPSVPAGADGDRAATAVLGAGPAAGTVVGAGPGGPAPAGAPPAADQVLVQFPEGTGAEQQASVLAGHGLTAGGTVPGTAFVTVPVGPADADALAVALQAEPLVEEAQADHVRAASGRPDDPVLQEGCTWYWEPVWPCDWNRPAEALELARLPEAWARGTGHGVVIAVLDTGIAPDHAELAGRVDPGYDFVDDDADPASPYGHGTAVAGVAVAAGDNGVGTIGAAWGARVMPVRVLDPYGLGTDSDIAAGIAWASERGADVINLSLGAPQRSPVLRAAIERAVAAGAVVVAAAGDRAVEEVQYPAAYAPDVAGLLAVSSVDATGEPARVPDFDSQGYGVAEGSSWGEAVTLAAPGAELLVPDPDGVDYLVSGTSFAAGLVSGVAALVRARGEARPDRIEQVLTSSARDAGPRGVDPYFGAGIVDAAAAVGLRPGVPVAQPAADAGPDDGAPARAQALRVGAIAAQSLSPQGDEDWFGLEAPARGWYLVTVVPLAPSEVQRSHLLPAVTVLDGEGRVLHERAGTPSTGGVVQMFVPVPAPGTFTVGIRAQGARAEAGDSRYAVLVQPGTPNRFRRHVTQGVGWAAGLAVGDMNGDGLVDALQLDVGSQPAVVVHPGRGDGWFGTPTVTPLPATGAGPAVADVDGDRDDDAVVWTSDGIVTLTQRDGRLTAGAPDPVDQDGVTQILLADMDGDRDQDLVATSHESVVLDPVMGTGQYWSTTRVYRNDGRGRFDEGTQALRVLRWTMCEWDGVVAVGDVDSNGLLDVVAADGAVVAQQRDGRFTPLPGLEVQPEDDNPFNQYDVDCVGLADVTGDGHLDAVRSADVQTPRVMVEAGNGDGTFDRPVLYDTDEQPESLRFGDVDGDDRTDVVVAHGLYHLTVLRQRPDGTLGSYERTNVYTTGRDGMEIADLNRDGNLDVLVFGTRDGAQIQALMQNTLDEPPGDPAWVLDSSPAMHGAGVGTRPTVTLRLGRRLAAGAVDARTVRLLDADGADVAATRAYDPATGELRLRPSGDLRPGHHYAAVVTGLQDASGEVQARAFRTWFTIGADGQRFTPLEPYRATDTREPTPSFFLDVPPHGPVAPGSPLVLKLTGRGLLPIPPRIPDDATAVVLNVTAVNPTAGGNVRVYPTPARPGAPPTVSNVNVVPGVTQPNAVTVALGVDGQVTLATDGTTADLVVDVAGYYSPGGSTAYVPTDPARVLDTRDGTGDVPSRAVAAGGWVDVVVAGRAEVPSDAAAVVLNVTASAPDRATNIRVYAAPPDAADQTPPLVSHLNVVPGRDQANLVTVPLGEDGGVRLYSQSATVHLVADVAGYYSATGTHGFVALEPTRVADTRDATGLPKGPLLPGTPAQLQVTGANGVPAGADAVVVNVTAVHPDRPSNVRVYPSRAGQAAPTISNLNVVAGRDEANLAVVRLGSGGGLSFYSQTARTHLAVDVAGYFTE